MRKTYRYKDLSFAVADETKVNLTVKYISDGNMGNTAINVPGALVPDIPNSGTQFIGKGSELRGDKTVVSTVVENLIPNEDEIRIEYWLNDQLLQEHVNSKSVADRIIIILSIKFVKP